MGRIPCQSHTVSAQLPGYLPASAQITASASGGWIVLDLLFTGLLGLIVDGISGDWNEFDTTNLTLTLTPTGIPFAPPPAASPYIVPAPGPAPPAYPPPSYVPAPPNQGPVPPGTW